MAGCRSPMSYGASRMRIMFAVMASSRSKSKKCLVSRATRFRHQSGARYYALGQTLGGRYLFVVVDDEGGGWVYPVTARDMTRRERRLLKKGRKP